MTKDLLVIFKTRGERREEDQVERGDGNERRERR